MRSGGAAPVGADRANMCIDGFMASTPIQDAPASGTSDRDDKKSRRHTGLLQRLESVGYASVEEMAALFDVTVQTIRRDITELSAEGRVRRYHGGAALGWAIDPVTYRNRRIERVAAKRSIAERVAELIPDGSSIFLDAGTTCEAVATALTVRSNLKVVTYNLHAATLLSDRTDFTIAVPAGFVRNVDASVIGETDSAIAFLQRFRFDWAIISVSGIEEDGRMADDDYAEVALVRAALDRSRNVILAADSTKFGRSGLVELCNIRQISTVVTDAKLNEAFQAMIETSGTQVVIGS